MPSKKIVKSKHYFEEDFEESIAEVSTGKYPNWENNRNLSYVGKPISGSMDTTK